jgi:hypothetical protein
MICRFDNWTRMVAGKRDRRTAVMGIAAGAAALLTLARAGPRDVSRPSRERCQRF